MDGELEEFFRGIGYKRLRSVECISEGSSRQQAINVSAPLRDVLGTVPAEEKRVWPCSYFRFEDDIVDGTYVADTSTITYNDARANKEHRSPEYRLTYPSDTQTMTDACPGDYCWIGMRRDRDHVVVILAAAGSDVGAQLDRLFATGMRGTHSESASLTNLDIGTVQDEEITIEDAELLEILGVRVRPRHPDLLTLVLERYGHRSAMPAVREFAQFTREICPTGDPASEPDAVLNAWYQFTTEMFYGLEKHIVGPVIDAELANLPTIPLDKFFSLSKKFQNARFSRAGYTWEYHLSALFKASGLAHEHNHRKLRDGTKPDFLFPNTTDYEDLGFPDESLTVLGAKTSTKERWLQLVAEGSRSQQRYLATLDRDLNTETLKTMQGKGVLPVIPQPVVDQYYKGIPGAETILNVQDFISLARAKERNK